MPIFKTDADQPVGASREVPREKWPGVWAPDRGSWSPRTMSTDTPNGLERTVADEQPCDDCADLPDGWPCADCFITDGKSITAEEYDS